jgi:hypothetical protein
MAREASEENAGRPRLTQFLRVHEPIVECVAEVAFDGKQEEGEQGAVPPCYLPENPVLDVELLLQRRFEFLRKRRDGGSLRRRRLDGRGGKESSFGIARFADGDVKPATKTVYNKFIQRVGMLVGDSTEISHLDVAEVVYEEMHKICGSSDADVEEV